MSFAGPHQAGPRDRLRGRSISWRCLPSGLGAASSVAVKGRWRKKGKAPQRGGAFSLSIKPFQGKAGSSGSGGRRLGVEVSCSLLRFTFDYQAFAEMRCERSSCGVCLVSCDCVPRVNQHRGWFNPFSTVSEAWNCLSGSPDAKPRCVGLLAFPLSELLDAFR